MRVDLVSRTFLCVFVPTTLVLLTAFLITQRRIQTDVQAQVRESIKREQGRLEIERRRGELQDRRFLKLATENAALKAGLQLLLANRTDADARRTVEDQLREILAVVQCDLLAVAGYDGAALAGVVSDGASIAALDGRAMPAPQAGLFTVSGKTYQTTSLAIDLAGESLGTLTIGERLDLAAFSLPVVLLRSGHVVASNLPELRASEVEQALRSCPAAGECEPRIAGDMYLSLPVESVYFKNAFELRSLRNTTVAGRPLLQAIRNVFTIAGAVALIAALVTSLVTSRSIAGPIAGLVAGLRACERTGTLPEFPGRTPGIREIAELMEGFNRAAVSIRAVRGDLERAHVEFVSLLASALDARDRYTAGHSSRVSEYSLLIANAMAMPESERECLRVGALLHDIGKIGVPDNVLQKPGKLTAAEFAIIQEHPTIGRRILERVTGLRAYLDVVELHHENHDGSGYPHGLAGRDIPVCARIVHVADAFDAMTSDRPYRRGMGHSEALRLLQENAGTQFDPDVVRAFAAHWTGCHDDLRALTRAVTHAEALVESSTV